MNNLTQTAFYTRRAVNIFVISVIGFFVVRAAIKTSIEIYRHFVPQPPPPPNTAFGKIPAVIFPDNPELPELTYKLETIEGALPPLPTTGKVYFMPQKKPSLFDMERAVEKVNLFGFTGEGQQLSEVIYRWQKQTEPITYLELNIANGNFHYRYLYEDNPGLVEKNILPTNEQAAAEARSFLSSKSAMPEDLDTGTAEFTYYQFTPPLLTPVISLSEADFIQVNLYRQPLDELKILSTDPLNSPVSILFSGSRDPQERIAEVKFRYFPIDRDRFATYPLKPVEVAWQELQGGRAYVASPGNNPDGKITIRKVSLAYFEADESQLFLQPIFVFEGDRDFFAYVPAIDTKWVEARQE